MINDSKNGFLWIFIVSGLILLLGSIPTWAGYQAETNELRFRGIFYDSQDYAVHIAMMEAGKQGEWAYQFRFTTEPHHPAYIRLFYIVLGHLGRWLGLAVETLFQVARWFFGFTALFALYGLMRQIFPVLFWARIAFLLTALGSGLGWLQLVLDLQAGQITPIDFWLADAYVFFSLAIFPHFAFVTAAMCVVLNLWLKFLGKPHWRNVAVIGLIGILVQFVNPIAFATVDASLVGATLFSWWRANRVRAGDIGALSIIAIAQTPLLMYNFLVLSNDPLWSQFTAQNLTLSPPPDYYVWGFALFWPLAIAGMIIAVRHRSIAGGAAAFWVISAFMLAYAPVYIQRRFLQNITIPLSVLAIAGLIYFLEAGSTRFPGLLRWRTGIAALFVFLASISSLQLGLSYGAYLQTYPENLYYPASLDPAILWFRENAKYNDFVLASEETSQVLAQKTGLRAYLGHEMETLDYKIKRAQIEAFFQGQLPELADEPIQWVVYGPTERRIRPDFQPMNNLDLVYSIQDLQIFQVK